MYTGDEPPKLTPKDAALKRDDHSCRFRFAGCRGRASDVMFNQPTWLGGEGSATGLRSVCPSCAKTQQAQRAKAAAVFGIIDGSD